MKFKTGRRPPKGEPALTLNRYLTGTVPAHPASDDNLARLGGGWQMLGNDSYGDCVAVTWANVRRVVTSLLSATPSYPTLEQVLAFYKTQNPNFPSDDNGMDIQTALEYLVTNGGPDGVKALGFAKVDHTDAQEVQAAIAIFGYLWTGVQVLDANQQEFADGHPWDYVPSSSIDGGHSVITGGYGAGSGELSGDEKFITWARETSFTDAYWDHEVEEAWVVVWPESINDPAFLAGIDLPTFAADYAVITGRPFPVAVTPTPNPTPSPTPPAPVPVDPSVLRVIIADLEELLAMVERLGAPAAEHIRETLRHLKSVAG